jgi:hypothetical protein
MGADQKCEQQPSLTDHFCESQTLTGISAPAGIHTRLFMLALSRGREKSYKTFTEENI